MNESANVNQDQKYRVQLALVVEIQTGEDGDADTEVVDVDTEDPGYIDIVKDALSAAKNCPQWHESIALLNNAASQIKGAVNGAECKLIPVVGITDPMEI